MFTVIKDGHTMHLHDEVQLSAYKKSGWAETGGVQNTTQNQERPEEPVNYAMEGLERMERKELFRVADSYGIEYANNIPTTKLIEQIITHQDSAR